jgi:hypothetical protein
MGDPFVAARIIDVGVSAVKDRFLRALGLRQPIRR